MPETTASATISADPRYEELVRAFLEYMANINGRQLTAMKAVKVNGLMVAANLAVKITGSPQQVITDLLKEFETLSGHIVYNFFKQATAAVRAKYPDLKVPKEIEGA